MSKAALLLAIGAASSLLIPDVAFAQQRDRSERVSREPTLAERQAAWSRNKAEYRQRLRRDGQASADRWLNQQALAARRGGGARGSQATQGDRSPDARAAPGARPRTKNCKKVRWVNRATPGFGGGPMTMSRVAVCAD